MKRGLIYCLILVASGLAVWKLPSPAISYFASRSATIRLEPIGYDLTFAVAWGWGMEQKFSFDPVGAITARPSSGWQEVWDKPYNAALAVYRSVDGGIYYLSTGGWGLAYTFDVQSKALKPYCTGLALRLTDLGNRVRQLEDKGHDALEAVDPGATTLWRFVESKNIGTLAAKAPRSRYYEGLEYLGKFGVIPNSRGRGRGEDVGFSPASMTPEPRLGLSANC